MPRDRQMRRRVISVVLIFSLTLLVVPSAPASAKGGDTPLPGYSTTEPSPDKPQSYKYPSANGLRHLPKPSAEDLFNIPPGKWGSQNHLWKKWKEYQQNRKSANPLSFDKYREEYVRVYNNYWKGRTFEELVKKWGYFDNKDGVWRFNMKLPEGANRRPDALNDPEYWAEGRSWLWDFKTGWVDKEQLKDFIRYAMRNNLKLGLIFDEKPSEETIKGLDNAAAEVAKEKEFEGKTVPEIAKRFMNVAPEADPPAESVLAPKGQNPTTGGLEDTVDDSPDSAEGAEERAYVDGQMDEDKKAANTEQAPANSAHDPASTPGQAPASTPGQAPTEAPTEAPTQAPTEAPTEAPTQHPTAAPSKAPTAAPTQAPTVGPVATPTAVPTAKPTAKPPAAPVPAHAPSTPAPSVAAQAAERAGKVLRLAGKGVPNLVPNIRGGLTGTAAGVGSPIRGVLGGVDFSTLELRYVADTDYNGAGLRYAFAANTVTSTEPSYGGHTNAYMASDSFFVWLALPTSAFTVNLNPNEPTRIIDSEFGRTDAGRILLEADYSMKKLTAKFIDPDTPDGRKFMDALQGSKCFSAQRKWITPLPASVSQQGDQMYILDAPLDVKLEILGDDLKAGIGCPKQDQSLTRANDDLYRSAILPKIVDAINHSSEFADLRRVYASRVAAEWYRQRSTTKATAYKAIIDSGNIDSWTSKDPWSPQDVFTRYRKSFYEGDATFKWKTDDRTTWTMTIGGVDFTDIPIVNMTPADFVKAHPTMPETTSDSLFGPQFENSGGQVWLGGLTSTRPLTEVWKGDPKLYAPLPDWVFGSSLSPIMYAAIILPLAAWAGAGGVLLWRRRRPSAYVGRR